MKKHYSTFLLILVFMLGLGIMLYPTLSDYWNSFHSSQAIVNYDQMMSELTPTDYSEYYEAAERYNSELKKIKYPLMYYKEVNGYEETLNVSKTGIMGYITIPMIGVELPIYHGTSEVVLSDAVGHLEGTSLPVGGIGTHTVLSAHRGLPSARLFTDLDKLVVGDTFVLSILDRELTYEVDQILIVEPDAVEDLYVVEGEDYCTLVTCTPYGINTHRLLVRGHRVENAEEVRVARVIADAVQIEPIAAAPLIAAPILFVLLIYLLVSTRKR